MKRGIKLSITYTCIVILLILIMPLVLAVEVTFSKDSYQPQELFQAEITGHFLSLNSENVFIYKDDKAHPEPVIKDITKQNNKYYFYAVLPNYEGNFSFRIENTEYLERGILKSAPISVNITVEYKNISDLMINPGFVIPNKDFEIKVKSLYLDQEITATFEVTGESKTLSLVESIEEPIKFSLPEGAFPQISNVIIKEYVIPIFLINRVDPIVIEKRLEFIPYELIGTIAKEESYYFVLVLKNTGEVNMTNITLLSDLNAYTAPQIIELLEPEESKIINLTLSVPENQTGKELNGKLTAISSDGSFYLPIIFDITNNESEVQVEDTKNLSIPSKTKPIVYEECADIGEICQEKEVCNGEEIGSLDGPCCIGECQEKEKSFSWFGLILIIALILIVVYIIWKVRKKGRGSPRNILNERTSRYKERMKAGPNQTEVSGKLDNV